MCQCLPVYSAVNMYCVAGISEDEYIQGLSSMAAIHDARRLAHPYLNKASSTLGPSLEQQAMVSLIPCYITISVRRARGESPRLLTGCAEAHQAPQTAESHSVRPATHNAPRSGSVAPAATSAAGSAGTAGTCQTAPGPNLETAEEEYGHRSKCTIFTRRRPSVTLTIPPSFSSLPPLSYRHHPSLL